MKKFYIILIALFMVSGAMAQWFPQNSGTTNDLNDVYFTDANTGYIVGDSGTILKTIDGGAIWETLSSGTYFNLFSVHFPAANRGYAAGSNPNDEAIILKTVDGGTNWTVSLLLSNLGYPITFRDVFFTDSITGYALGSHSDATMGIYNWVRKTTDGGTTWTSFVFDTESDCYLSSIFFTDANTGYAVGYSGWWYQGIILKTNDGATTWGEYLPPSTGCLNSIYFTDANTGYAVGYNFSDSTGAILKTNDGGTIWDALSSGTNSGIGSVFFPDINNGYALGYNYIDSVVTIIKTNDGGTNWTTLSSGISNHLNSIHFTDADAGYAVGENGTIFKTTNGGLPVGINDKPLTTESLQIYPNPSSTTITIITPTPPQKNTTLTIFNINGQHIIQRQITEQQTVVDVAGLSTGIYVVKVVSDDGVIVGKFVKQ